VRKRNCEREIKREEGLRERDKMVVRCRLEQKNQKNQYLNCGKKVVSCSSL